MKCTNRLGSSLYAFLHGGVRRKMVNMVNIKYGFRQSSSEKSGPSKTQQSPDNDTALSFKYKTNDQRLPVRNARSFFLEFNNSSWLNPTPPPYLRKLMEWPPILSTRLESSINTNNPNTPMPKSPLLPGITPTPNPNYPRIQRVFLGVWFWPARSRTFRMVIRIIWYVFLINHLHHDGVLMGETTVFQHQCSIQTYVG